MLPILVSYALTLALALEMLSLSISRQQRPLLLLYLLGEIIDALEDPDMADLRKAELPGSFKSRASFTGSYWHCKRSSYSKALQSVAHILQLHG